MGKEVVCFIEMFDRAQSIIFPDGHEVHIALDDVPSYVPAVCYNHNVFKIHFYGANEFIEGIIDKIQINEKHEYGKSQLQFEVN